MPLPVSAATMTSPPPRISGMASSCVVNKRNNNNDVDGMAAVIVRVGWTTFAVHRLVYIERSD